MHNCAMYALLPVGLIVYNSKISFLLLDHFIPSCMLNLWALELVELERTCGLNWRLVKLGSSC
jgi:hypothetical protein